jgi:hypothetical protein
MKDNIQLEIKAHENKRTTQGYLRELGRQIRGNVKQNTSKKLSITRVLVPDDGPKGLCKQIIGKYDVEDHLVARKMDQFSHAMVPRNLHIQSSAMN